MNTILAHPRSRGEHWCDKAGRAVSPGSSPLARGTSRQCSFPWKLRTAHPRSRGEHSHAVELKRFTLGSSPLARGTSASRTGNTWGYRLIPARAGNMDMLFDVIALNSAHPRSRGEHYGAFQHARRQAGSSPLARGTWITLRRRPRIARLIPARAGNILIMLSARFGMVGSSPLARGTSHLRSTA